MAHPRRYVPLDPALCGPLVQVQFCLYPLESKHATGVCAALNNCLFPYFGVLRILHSDNGREFINRVIEELLKSWHSDIQLVSGRPRHPQSQGLVERAHYTLQRKLSAEINRLKAKSPPWAAWLPRIVCEFLRRCCLSPDPLPGVV